MCIRDSLTEVSPYFSDLNCDETHQGPGQKDNVEWAMKEEPVNSLPFVLMDINTLAYNNRSTMAAGTRAYLDALQAQIIAQQEIVDGVMKNTPAGGRTALANKAQMTVVEQTYLKCDKLLDEMRAYINAGDFSKPFAPSDLNAEGNGMVDRLAYADAIVAPTITQQPSGATYEKGAKAVDLTVAAAAASGAGELSYEWFSKVGDDLVSTGVKTANFPVDTSKVGEFAYLCRVTNGQGLAVDSDAAVVTVKAPAAPADPKPEPPATTPDTSKPSKKPGSGLPQTGDPLSLVAVSACALAGAGAIGYGIRSKRRNLRGEE